VSTIQPSTTMLAEAVTLRQKWYSNMFEMLSKFVPVDMDDIKARVEKLQCQVNDDPVQEEGEQDVVGESSRTAEDLAPST
ncbi:hypothetical protein AMTR_s00308p00010940, partial [Amborella trichopoda]